MWCQKLQCKPSVWGPMNNIGEAMKNLPHLLSNLLCRPKVAYIAHALQAWTEANLEATILSVDGIGAFDWVSRGTMLQGCVTSLHQQCRSSVNSVEPRPVICGKTTAERSMTLTKEKGGEQGDLLMPMLFSLGQHNALRAIQVWLQEGELTSTYLDDVYIVCSPERVSAIFAILQEELWRHARTRIHHGKTRGEPVWQPPVSCDVQDRATRSRTGSRVHHSVERRRRRRTSAPRHYDPRNALGEDFVRAFAHIVDEHNVLLERIPSLPDVQSAWALLLHCANARANYALRVIRQELARHFAQAHDAGLWRCVRHPEGWRRPV